MPPINDPVTWILWKVREDPATWRPRLEAAVRGIKDENGNSVFDDPDTAGLPTWSLVVFSDQGTWPYP